MKVSPEIKTPAPGNKPDRVVAIEVCVSYSRQTGISNKKSTASDGAMCLHNKTVQCVYIINSDLLNAWLRTVCLHQLALVSAEQVLVIIRWQSSFKASTGQPRNCCSPQEAAQSQRPSLDSSKSG